MANLSPDQYYASLARKRMASGLLLFDSLDRILIVKPSYKKLWSIPGGVIDENESPREAALRETAEEIGLQLTDINLVCVHYTKLNPPRTESIQFVFSGGVLNKKDIELIKLQSSEIEEYRFVSEEEAVRLLEVNLNFRLPFCLSAAKSGTVAYIES